MVFSPCSWSDPEINKNQTSLPSIYGRIFDFFFFLNTCWNSRNALRLITNQHILRWEMQQTVHSTGQKSFFREKTHFCKKKNIFLVIFKIYLLISCWNLDNTNCYKYHTLYKNNCTTRSQYSYQRTMLSFSFS